MQVRPEGNSYICDFDGKVYDTMERRYVMLLKASDESGEAYLNLFNDQVGGVQFCSKSLVQKQLRSCACGCQSLSVGVVSSCRRKLLNSVTSSCLDVLLQVLLALSRVVAMTSGSPGDIRFRPSGRVQHLPLVAFRA